LRESKINKTMSNYNQPRFLQLIKNEGTFINPSYFEFDGNVQTERDYETALGGALDKGFTKEDLWIVITDMNDIEPDLIRPETFEDEYAFSNEIEDGVQVLQHYPPNKDMGYDIYEYNLRIFMPKPIQI
jgi:hypothetical protein